MVSRRGVAVAAVIATAVPAFAAFHTGDDSEKLSVVWSVRGAGHGTPAIVNGRVYFLAHDHTVLALDMATGRLLWRAPTGERTGSTTGSRVMWCADHIVVGDYTVIAFDAGTGEVAWRFTPPAGYGAGYYVGDVSGSSLVAGSPAGRLYSIDCASGALEWSATIARNSRTSVYEPIVDGSLAVAGYTSFTRQPAGGLVAVDRATGQVRWRVPFPAPSDPTLGTGAVGRPVVVGSLVIAASANGVVHAVDRTTGARRWTIAALEKGAQTAAAEPGRDLRGLVVAGPLLIVGSLTGWLTAYDIATQAVRWRYRAPERGSIGFRLRVVGKRVYVPYVDGVLHCIDAATGQREWAFGSWRDGFIWPPAVDGDSLYVAGVQAGFLRLRVSR